MSSSKNDAPRPPSKDVEPTKANTAPQQASTSTDDGTHIPADQIRNPSEVDRNDPNIKVVEIPAEKTRSPSFKEQVFGYAKVIRGTALGKSNVKEHGEQVLRGEGAVPAKRRSSTSD
ncbi:hypothetical protein EV702DRAFT_724748 [Suillus placidus]|uniref:Uncharacterized protein n=1 Tax=Suillus placidus TaxID=48579 RepID=A0A9P7A1U7_9AGAM|nr:hypothetical protein EV702DRAFT_724748 [Suillus placidus]